MFFFFSFCFSFVTCVPMMTRNPNKQDKQTEIKYIRRQRKQKDCNWHEKERNDCQRTKTFPTGYLAHKPLFCYKRSNYFVHHTTVSYNFGPSLNNYINKSALRCLKRNNTVYRRTNNIQNEVTMTTHDSGRRATLIASEG